MRLRRVAGLLGVVALCGVGLAQQVCVGRPVPAGLIAERWQALGGAQGPLGCAVVGEQPVKDRPGRMQAFEHGAIATSPDNAAQALVAVYQQADNLIVNWGDLAPHDYDHFNILITPLGGSAMPQVVPPMVQSRRGFYRMLNPKEGYYTVLVEGCREHSIAIIGLKDTCDNWMSPLTVAYNPPVPYVGRPRLVPAAVPQANGYEIPLGGPAGVGTSEGAFRVRAAAVSGYNA